MSKISRKEQLEILEMVTEIAAEAAGNQNIVWMIEFQEELVTRLYGKFCELLSNNDFDEGEKEKKEEVDEEDEEKAEKSAKRKRRRK